MFDVRALDETDYTALRAAVNAWTDGVNVLPLFPRHVLRHFSGTQFIAFEDGKPCGVISGFISQSVPGEAYVRVIALAPSVRGRGAGRKLYERFFDAARTHGCDVVRAITSPGNRASIAFHRALGFDVEPGDIVIDGVPATRDHAAPGEHRVLLVKRLAE